MGTGFDLLQDIFFYIYIDVFEVTSTSYRIREHPIQVNAPPNVQSESRCVCGKRHFNCPHQFRRCKSLARFCSKLRRTGGDHGMSCKMRMLILDIQLLSHKRRKRQEMNPNITIHTVIRKANSGKQTSPGFSSASSLLPNAVKSSLKRNWACG